MSHSRAAAAVALSCALSGVFLARLGSAQQPTKTERHNLEHASRCTLTCRDDNGASVPCGAKSQRPAPPPYIRIGKVTYTVELVKEVPAALEISGLSGKTCDEKALRKGWCKVKDHIYLESGRPLQQERISLLHEIQHGLLGTDKSDRKITTHQFIYNLSPKLLEVLQENPDLYFYLTVAESSIEILHPAHSSQP